MAVFEINLKDLLIIKIADELWCQEEICNKTKTYFCSPTKFNKLKTWNMLTNEVVKQMDPEVLPEIFYTEIVYAIINLGRQKRDFFTYCRQRNIFRDVPREQLYEHYFKKIYWTYYGTINVEEVIKSWFINPNCDQFKVFVMASCFCSVEVVKEMWSKAGISDESEKKLLENFGGHMAAYWNRHFDLSRADVGTLYFMNDILINVWEPSFYSESESCEKNMFKLSIGKGYKLATEYFFSKLSETERRENILENFDLALHRHYSGEIRPSEGRNVATHFRENQSIEIILFLLNCFGDINLMEDVEDKTDFSFNGMFHHILRLITRWPYVKLIVPFVNKTRKYLSEEHYKSLLSSIISQECFVTSSMDNIYRWKFIELWKMVPFDYKKNFIEDHDFISSLFSAWDTTILKIVLNDKAVGKQCGKVRNDIFINGRKKFETFIEKDNQKKIREFVTLLIPTKLDKHVIVNMDMIYHHVMNGDFGLADQVLESFCCSENERISFKYAINSYIICYYFIKKNQLDLADQFLKWQFDSEKLVDEFKLTFVNDPFSVDHILKLWNTEKEHVEEAKLQSNNFLEWFLKSRKSIDSFIEKHLKNSDSIKKMITTRNYDNYEILDDFLSWCLMNEQEKKNFKDSCFSDEYYLMSKVGRYVRRNNWSRAEAFLNWKFDSLMRKTKFINKFLKSKRWVYECILFIFNTCSSDIFGRKPSKDEVKQNLDEFIDTCMKPIEKRTVKQLKKFFRKWPKTLCELLKENEEMLKTEHYSTDEFDIEVDEYDLSVEFSYIDTSYEEGHIRKFLEAFRESLALYYEDDYILFEDNEDCEDDENSADSDD